MNKGKIIEIKLKLMKIDKLLIIFLTLFSIFFIIL